MNTRTADRLAAILFPHPSIVPQSIIQRGDKLVVVTALRHGEESPETGSLTEQGARQITEAVRRNVPEGARLHALFSSQEARAAESLIVAADACGAPIAQLQNRGAIFESDHFGYGIWRRLRVDRERHLRPIKERLIAKAKGEHRNVTAREWILAFPQIGILRRFFRQQLERVILHATRSTDDREVAFVLGVGHSCSIEIALPPLGLLPMATMLEHGEANITGWVVKPNGIIFQARTMVHKEVIMEEGRSLRACEA